MGMGGAGWSGGGLNRAKGAGGTEPAVYDALAPRARSAARYAIHESTPGRQKRTHACAALRAIVGCYPV